jgi:hypothetical protein
MTAVRVPGVKPFIAGHGRLAMPPSLAFVTSRWAPDRVARTGLLRVALLVALNLAAVALMLWSEGGIVANSVFLLTWGLVNCFWLVLLRRPLVAAALSLMLIVALILLSRLKYDIIWMTANFLDVWIVNADTIHFMLSVKPDLVTTLVGAGVLAVPVLALIWWIDGMRVRRRSAAIGLAACLAGLAAISFAFPQQDWES